MLLFRNLLPWTRNSDLVQSQACLVKTTALLLHTWPGDETRGCPLPWPLPPQPHHPLPLGQERSGVVSAMPIHRYWAVAIPRVVLQAPGHLPGSEQEEGEAHVHHRQRAGKVTRILPLPFSQSLRLKSPFQPHSRRDSKLRTGLSAQHAAKVRHWHFLRHDEHPGNHRRKSEARQWRCFILITSQACHRSPCLFQDDSSLTPTGKHH